MGDDNFVSKEDFQEAIDKMVKIIGDLGRKLDTDLGAFRQEQARLNASITNV